MFSHWWTPKLKTLEQQKIFNFGTDVAKYKPVKRNKVIPISPLLLIPLKSELLDLKGLKMLQLLGQFLKVW